MENGRLIAFFLGIALVGLVAFSFYSSSVVGGNKSRAKLENDTDPSFISDFIEE